MRIMAYHVYTLMDGMVGESQQVDSLDDAYSVFRIYTGMERSRSQRILEYIETTIHIADTETGDMIAEECIVPNFLDPHQPLFGVGVPVSETWLQG